MSNRCGVGLASGVLLLAVCVGCISHHGKGRNTSNQTVRGEWPSPAYDRGRTSRTPATGEIREPEVAWQLDVSAREYSIVVTPERDREGRCHLAQSLPLKALDETARLYWGLKEAPFDVDGDGVPDPEPPRGGQAIWAKFLPGVNGLQRVDFGNPMRLYSFENGVDKPRLVWETPIPSWLDQGYIVPVAADCDGDGRKEICIARWNEVAVFDASTGQQKYRRVYRPGVRPYGFFACYDDPERGPYLVAVGHRAGHAEALAVRDGELKLLWYHQFDPNDAVTLRRTCVEIPRDSIGDFDGDGRPEAMVNTFNVFKDGRWHLIGYDLETGEPNIDLPDVHLWGHADVDGDGQEELLTQVCPRRPRGTYGELRVYKGKNVVWTHPYARWSLFSPPYPAFDRDQFSSEGGRYAAVKARFGEDRGDTVFITVPKAGVETLQALHFHDGKPQVAWSITATKGLFIEAAAARPDAVLVSVRAGFGERADLQAHGARLEAVAASPVTGRAQALVLRDVGNRPVIAVSDPLARLTAWRVTCDAENILQLLWKRPGRAQAEGLESADIDGDGVNEVLAVREAREGHGQLVAYGLDGTVRWVHDFVDFDGHVPRLADHFGIELWKPGHLLDPKRWDIIVTTRRTKAKATETGVINTKDNSVAWWGDRLLLDRPMADKHVPRLRAFGGAPVALADYDGDGLDDIAQQHDSEHWNIKGTNGEIMTGIVTWPADAITPDYAGREMWGAPCLAADLDGDGKPESLVAYRWCIVAFKPVPPCHLAALWYTPAGDGANNAVPAVADVNGDGKLELGVAGCKEGFRCMDAATGKTLWSVPAEGRASNTVAADIDGDGREDFVFGRGKRLMAVTQADEGPGRIVWELEMPVEITEVAVADWDGDGKAEVVVCGADGRLYGVR